MPWGNERERHSWSRDCRRLTYGKDPPVCALALARAGDAHSGAPGRGGWRPPDLILPLPLDAVLPLWALGGGWGRCHSSLALSVSGHTAWPRGPLGEEQEGGRSGEPGAGRGVGPLAHPGASLCTLQKQWLCRGPCVLGESPQILHKRLGKTQGPGHEREAGGGGTERL